MSSIAVAGDYAETFTEAMFDEGQTLPHAYHRSKFESEKLVRESGLEFRIYRPSAVVGDSKTGAMDRIDGVYFSFAAIKKLAYALPAWVRVPVPRIRGRFNVDYVADAMVGQRGFPRCDLYLRPPRWGRALRRCDGRGLH